jgi:indole-3-glycerol phosphate synthase
MLDEIIGRTKLELEARKAKIPASLFNTDGKARSLKAAIVKAKDRNAIITEIKPASPSEGMIKAVDPEETAKAMERGGACALSVLTEPFFFHGSLNNLTKAKYAVEIPVMRKDFIIDEYQLLEAKHYGADAVLLMVSVLGDKTKEFYEKVKALGMEALVEVHDKKELPIAVASGAEIIGINNRNLKDLSIDLNITKELSAGIPKGRIIVSESGVKDRKDLDIVLKHADAALVGTSMMRAGDVEKAVRELVRK